MDPKDRRETLKEIIREIHAGADLEVVKKKFQEKLGDVSATDIGRAEQELVEEGMPREQIRRLCDVHLAVMGDALGREEGDVAPGHPIHTFREEHERILEFLELLQKTVRELNDKPDAASVAAQAPLLEHVAEHLMEVEKHNVREENVLFPHLEKRGITEPPAVMWSEHNDLRNLKKRLKEVLAAREQLPPEEFVKRLSSVAGELGAMLSSHIFKENNILYPMALKVVPREEWPDIRRQCDELGYCCFTPEMPATVPGEVAPAEALPAKTAAAGSQPAAEAQPTPPPAWPAAGSPESSDSRLHFPTGSLSREELEWMLNTLPVDITFVDKDDVFRYFSGTKDRVFARARASLGRKVQQCHPTKSLPLVNQLLDDFKSGRKDAEHFWIHLGDNYAYISYFAVRNEKGEYLGTLETIQDIAPLQKITGEKRLPD